MKRWLSNEGQKSEEIKKNYPKNRMENPETDNLSWTAFFF